MHWQIQEAKQRFSELVRSAKNDGPQIVTRHGDEEVVVIDITEYRHLTEPSMTFKDYLLSGPKVDDLEIPRSPDLPRTIEPGP
ncbi:prevent-host-death family protein [Spinactinospora alkalitolerans]|uniref:Antitoxin n=1 Tax=Spinactinospora alkalitolerans TaxID=687207 RepID=A0A852TTA0_9ACTN|nr:type II toxin-antitoxin system Phd/YefM family antitoxin [Spinactinospora alkalitolerans]NYE46082.1 prevent-host-death family protein [Spinactinospora alkalitolerans]